MKTWKACDHGDYGDNEGQCIAIIGDDKRIALVLGPDTPETRENADMISAAPDMLEACREALALLGNPDADSTDADRVERVLWVAVRKATGGEGGGV